MFERIISDQTGLEPANFSGVINDFMTMMIMVSLGMMCSYPHH